MAAFLSTEKTACATWPIVKRHSLNIAGQNMRAVQLIAELHAADLLDGKTAAFRLPEPITLRLSYSDDTKPESYRFTSSRFLFRALLEHLAADVLLVGVSARGWKLGPIGLSALNRALRTPTIRNGRLTIVNHFLQNKCTTATPMPGDFMALLAFLGIRPMLRCNKGS